MEDTYSVIEGSLYFIHDPQIRLEGSISNRLIDLQDNTSMGEVFMGEKNNSENDNVLEMIDSETTTNAFGWKNISLFFLTFIGVSLVLGMIIGFIFGIVDVVTGKELLESIFASHYMLILDALAFLVAYILFKSVRMFLKGAFSLAPLKEWKTYLYILIGIIVVYGSQSLIIQVLQLENASDQIDTFGLSDLSSNWFNMVVFYLAFTVITPIKEEIIYRGILYGFLDKNFNFWIGIIGSSMIFGILHTGHFLSATIMGMVFVLLYKLTRSLVVPILFHIIWNLYAVSGLLYAVNAIN